MQTEFRSRTMPVVSRRVTGLCTLVLWVIASTAGQAQQQMPLGQVLQQLTDPRFQQNSQSSDQSQGGALGGLMTLLNPGGTSEATPSQTGVIQPAQTPTGGMLPESRLEQIYSARAGVRLQQFGYDQVGHASAVTVPQTGAMMDDYVLGPGDQVIVSLRGQENNEFRANVDRNGQVAIPRLNPIAATGRTFGDFRQDVEAAVHRSYVATEAFVSIGTVRQISVMVSGEVNNPGQRLVTGLSSALDAILISGGVKKTGSLRNIRVQRGSREFVVDLYNILTASGSATQMRLADGDRILVPPLGSTVAVGGLVRKPGIFELPPHTSSISVHNLLSLSGGLEVRGRYRLSVLRVAPAGNLQIVPLADQGGTVADSEILNVQLGGDQTVSQATLAGGTPLAGTYPITTGTKLSDLLKTPGAMPPEPYALFGIIARKDPVTLLRTLVAFTPMAVLGGSEDQALQRDDIVRVLSVNEVRLLTNTVRLYLERQTAEQSESLNPLSQLTTNQPGTNQATGSTGVQALLNRGAADAALTLSERQRRDIAELANQVDPVTLQNMRAQNLAQVEQITGYVPQSPRGICVSGAYAGEAGSYFQADGSPCLLAEAPILTPAQQLAAATGQQPVAAVSTSAAALTPQEALVQLPRPATPAPNFQATDAMTGQVTSNREISSFGDLARQLNIDQLVLVNFLIDHQAGLNGAVSGPGSYFVGPNVPLQALVQAAGGTTNWADESGVELTSTQVDTQLGRSLTRQTQLPLRQGTLASYIVHPRDQLRFNQVFTDSGLGSATVEGEVRFTGTFQITRGEHLSNLLARAGGLTSTAYPYGTIFLRKSAADIERQGYNRAANEIEEELVVAMTRIGNDKIDAGSFGALQGFVTQLRNQKAIGRVTIAADPSVLATRPEMDPLLEPGDVVYIPQRPSTISVLGQVRQPGSLPYRSGNTLADYIEMAGGYGPSSDESNTFIVLPDGSARKVETSWLNFSTVNLPPGSSIVVPRDITPLDTRQLILDVTGIFSQLAVTAASLAVLSKQ